MGNRLRYETGRDMPPGMQMLLADQTVHRLRNAIVEVVNTPETQEAISAVAAVMARDLELDAVIPPLMTNGEKIRSMSDEDLTDNLFKFYQMTVEHDGGDIASNWCDLKGGCCDSDGEELDCTEEKRKACILRWLQTPAT